MSKTATKKKDPGNLGRSLMKDKFGRKNRTRNANSFLHTSELNDGQDWNRINFNSITEQTDVDNFLATAELAGTEFKAEKMNVKFIHPSSLIGVLTPEEKQTIEKAQENNKNLLRIPRRPPWDRSMSAEELAEAERAAFLDWRRSLVNLQEVEGITLTPYEKNLEFWRQLWRVIERSDVVIQIVDARNPLLFYCEDLSKYVKEVSINKENIILVNKADFLTEEQRIIWASYFEKIGIKALFYSAIQQHPPDILEESSSEVDKEDEKLNEDLVEKDEMNESYEDLVEKDEMNESYEDKSETYEELLEKDETYSDISNNLDDSLIKENFNDLTLQDDYSKRNINQINVDNCSYINSPKLLSRKELIDVFLHFSSGPCMNSSHIVIGLVGYPNVGKSSTINSLLEEKKVSVSATPGKTKHFQTLFLTNDILLCDCPGLVFPAFVSSKQEMIISGILPIDQMRDHVPPVNLVLSLIPRNILEATYGVRIPLPSEGEDQDRPPVSEEFISVYGYMRGFMTPRGIADHPRSARYILKDFINGKLLYCHAPPNISQSEYHQFKVDKVRKYNIEMTPHQRAATVTIGDRKSEMIDQSFYKEMSAKPHIKGQHKVGPNGIIEFSEEMSNVKKPWRIKPERKKREKARRRFAHLDQ